MILFFDGACAMCNNLVNFALKYNTDKNILFAPLQGTNAKNMLTSELTTNLSTVVFKKDDVIYTKSDAIIYLIVNLNWYFKVAYVLLIIPKFIRDKVYKLVANNRYKWFGSNTNCKILSLEEKKRILE